MNATSTGRVTIHTFDPAYAQDFAALNYEWLEAFFEVEPHDTEMLEAPQEYIMDRGGQIFFAEVDGKIVGTVALIKETSETFELAKMGVTSGYQGLRIGQQLMEAAIDYAKCNAIKTLFLESNTRLAPALNLYFKNGFRVVPPSECSPYARCNIRMKLDL